MAKESVELIFRNVIERISAALKSQGFAKRGTAFRHLTGGNSGIIEVQRSQSSNNQVIRFTLNVGVISGRLLDDFEPEVAKAGAMNAHLRLRIGSFLSPPEDIWWDIDSTTDPAALLGEMKPLLDDAARYILAHVADQQLIALWETGKSPGLTEGQRERNLRDLKAAPDVS